MPCDICMIVHNDITNDSRVKREAATLVNQGRQVTIVCIVLENKDLPAIETVDGYTIVRVGLNRQHGATPKTLGKLFRLLRAIPALVIQVRKTRSRVVHAHDFPGLLLAALAGIWRRPVVYDSHELFFGRTFTGMPPAILFVLKLLKPLEKFLARRAAAVLTVGDEVAACLAADLDIALPIVVRNTVDLRTNGIAEVPYPTEQFRIVAHTGRIFGGRYLSEQVASLPHLPEDIALLLMGDGPAEKQLKEQATALGVSHRFFIVPPVLPQNIAPTLAQAHVALILITAAALNYYLSLPNKFFEAIAAGLPVIASPIKEVKRLIEHYDLGVICDPSNPAQIAAAIMQVLEPANHARYKA
ncbi:MAG: glycosyltransferase, partial [Anaerolineae bacterium]|nr:glycosyltransferase [Anaerolineae bacterium]